MRLPALFVPGRLALLALLAVSGCDDGGDPDPGDSPDAGNSPDAGDSTDAGDNCPEVASSQSIQFDGVPAADALAGSTVSFRVRLLSVCGEPLGMAPDIQAQAGRVETVEEADGWTRVEWQLAPVPIDQTLTVQAGPIQQEVVVQAVPGTLAETTDFGGIADFMAAEGLTGTTEDLTILGDSLILPAPGGLLRLTADGEPTWMPNDALGGPLGVVADAAGRLWIADSGNSALIRVDSDGSTSAVLNADAPGELQNPNFLAFGPDGLLYISDPCASRILRVDPESGAVDATLDFDPAIDGSPNGLAFDPDGVLHAITGNAILQCRMLGLAPPDAELARIWRIPTDADGFGPAESLTEPLGTFGDGLAFDRDANLFFVATAVDGLSLSQNAIFVRRAVDGVIHPVAIAPEGVLYANLAFGFGAFDAQRLYISLLSVPPFAGDASRGAHTLDLRLEPGPLWQ